MIAIDNHVGLAQLIVWCIGGVLIFFGLSKRYPWTVSLAFCVTLFSALRIFQSGFNAVPIDPVVREFNSSAAMALISFLLTVLIAQSIQIATWIKVFKGVALLNGVLLCGGFLLFLFRGIRSDLSWTEIRLYEPWGVLLNASMSGCFNAAIFPLFLKRKGKFGTCLILASIFAAGRSLPVAVLFAGIGGFLWVQRRYRTLAFAVPLSVLTGFIVKGSHLFDPRGRGFIWSQSYSYFRDHLNHWWGSGLGGFYVIGPALTDKTLKLVFIWLHSDWLQTLFEQGFIGLVVVLIMYAHAMWRARSLPDLFGALIAFAAFGAANMPLRYPLAGLYGAVLIRWATEKKREGFEQGI